MAILKSILLDAEHHKILKEISIRTNKSMRKILIELIKSENRKTKKEETETKV